MFERRRGLRGAETVVARVAQLLAQVKYGCGHTVEPNLPPHDFKPGKDGRTFIERAADLKCRSTTRV